MRLVGDSLQGRHVAVTSLWLNGVIITYLSTWTYHETLKRKAVLSEHFTSAISGTYVLINKLNTLVKLLNDSQCR